MIMINIITHLLLISIKFRIFVLDKIVTQLLNIQHKINENQ